jgi:hypothetical protein
MRLNSQKVHFLQDYSLSWQLLKNVITLKDLENERVPKLAHSTTEGRQ